MRCLSFGAVTVPIALAALTSVFSGSAIAQELDCSRVYLGDLESDLRRAEAAAERAIREAQEAASEAESAKNQLSGLEELARDAERTLREAQAALAAARQEAEKGEAEDLDLGDRAALRMAVTTVEIDVYDAEFEAEDTARNAERARRRVLISDERVTSARQRATEQEEQAQKLRGIRDRSEACNDGEGSAGDGESGKRDAQNPSPLSDFAARTRGVAERAIERLRAEDERSHPEIEAEAKERLAALAESDPENALTDLMVGDSATSALAGAAWAALADDGERLEATMAAAVPAATIRNLAIAVSAATIDPVGLDPTRSSEEMRALTDLLIGEVGRRLNQVGNSAYVGTAIRGVEDEPAAAKVFIALLDTWSHDPLAAMAVEVVMRDPGTPGDLARTAVRLTPGNPWGAHATTQKSGLASIAREIRSEPIAERTALSAFIALVNRWGVANSSARPLMTAALLAETDDAALQLLREMAVSLLERSLRAVLD